jgi:hypothetical protein
MKLGPVTALTLALSQKAVRAWLLVFAQVSMLVSMPAMIQRAKVQVR